MNSGPLADALGELYRAMNREISDIELMSLWNVMRDSPHFDEMRESMRTHYIANNSTCRSDTSATTVIFTPQPVIWPPVIEALDNGWVFVQNFRYVVPDWIRHARMTGFVQTSRDFNQKPAERYTKNPERY